MLKIEEKNPSIAINHDDPMNSHDMLTCIVFKGFLYSSNKQRTKLEISLEEIVCSQMFQP